MIVIFLYLFDYSFPLIALICTNSPRFRVHPCSSVVGIISHRGTFFRGCIFDHWTSLNLTEPRMYISCFRVYLCPSVGILIFLRKRNLGAKVQQKMHICKKIARKFTFRCDFLANGLHWATVASGELLAEQGGVRRYKCVAWCEGAARIYARESLLSGAIYCDF